jgi:hypothetical protein
MFGYVDWSRVEWRGLGGSVDTSFLFWFGLVLRFLFFGVQRKM